MTRPSHAESARTLVEYHLQGVLSTIDRSSETPYGSVVEYAPLADGDLVIFVSDLADHTKNLEEDTRCSILVAEGLGQKRPLSKKRVTLMGEASVVEDEEEKESVRSRYLEAHPHAESYIGFHDFGFYRFSPKRLRYIGGFGRMSWVDAAAYLEAEPDPIRPASEGIIEHMNDDHADAMVDMAHGLAEAPWVESASMFEVDRYGFDLRATGKKEGDPTTESLRIDFDSPLDDPGQARQAMIALVERARQA